MATRLRVPAPVVVVVAASLLTACRTDRPPATPPSGAMPDSGTVTVTAAPVSPPPTSIDRPSPHPPPTTADPVCSTVRMLRRWSTTRLAEQTVVVPVREGAVARVTAEVAAGAGGVILFGNSAPADLASSLARLIRAAPGGIAPFVMSDEEGGAIQRMANLVGSVPSARQMGTTMTPAQIERVGLHLGRRLRAAGVTMDLAPVLDLDSRSGPNAANAIGTRSFSPDASIASAAGLAFADGLRAAGVIPVVKHFPGLGGATGNTDIRPAASLPWSDLQQAGLLPFQAAIRDRVPAIMVSNATVPGLTGRPASVSAEVITQVLRRRLGYTGLVLTDALSAGAVASAGYSVPRATVAALVAGADMVLFTAAARDVASVTGQVVRRVVSAVEAGTLARSRLVDAVAHILRVKRVNLCR